MIKLINEKIDYVDARYSTVGNYLDDLDLEISRGKVTLQEFGKDFLPLRTDTDQIWSGFYTTRPHLKSQIKRYSQFAYVILGQMSLLTLSNRAISQEVKDQIIS